ncbi:MAG: GNAT family N-acetyltransferase [Luteimonas sp.]
MSAGVEIVTLDDRRRWDTLHSLGGLPSQSSAHAWALSATGASPRLAVVEHHGNRLLIPFFERTFDSTHDVATVFGLSGMSMAQGGDFAPLLDRWREHATAQGWVSGYLQVSALSARPAGLPPQDVVVDNGNPMYFVDLDVANPLAHASAITRRKIRSAESNGVTTIRDREVLADAFLKLWPGSPWRSSATGTYDFPHESLRRWALDPSTLILGAGRDGAIEAVTLCLVAGQQAEFLFNASTEPGRAWSAFLLWQVMDSLSSQGVRCLNLGGGVRADDGLAQFKQRFGAISRAVHSVRQVYDPATFRALCEAAGVDDAGSRFPPYRYPPRTPMVPPESGIDGT